MKLLFCSSCCCFFVSLYLFPTLNGGVASRHFNFPFFVGEGFALPWRSDTLDQRHGDWVAWTLTRHCCACPVQVGIKWMNNGCLGLEDVLFYSVLFCSVLIKRNIDNVWLCHGFSPSRICDSVTSYSWSSFYAWKVHITSLRLKYNLP